MKKLTGTLLLITSLVLAWYYFDYKLSIIIFLALLGYNLEQSKNK